jgi:hypothetical protein
LKKELITQINKIKRAPGFKPFKGGVATYSVAFLTDKGVVNQPNGNSACHAGLQYPRRTVQVSKNDKPVAIFNSVCSIGVDEKVALRFLEWFFNYSPYHTAWHTKSAKTALKSGIMVGNTDVPANLVCGAMFASRSLWEHGARVAKVWDAFVTRGLHPDIAFMLGHYFSISGGDNINESPISWHVAVDGTSLDSSSILNFITGNRKDTKSYESIATYEYGSIHETWGKQNPLVKGVNLYHQQWLREAKKENKKSSNPFNKSAEVIKIPVDAATEYLTPIYTEKFKKWI